MADVQKTVSVPAGLDAVGVILIQLLASIKGGVAPLAAAEAAGLALVAQASVLGELAGDLQDPQVYMWGGLFAGQVAQTLVTGKAPAAIA